MNFLPSLTAKQILTLIFIKCFVFRNLINQYCATLQVRFSQHLTRGQLIAYFYSLKVLFKNFPVARDSHFLFGEEGENKKKMEDDEIKKDPM